MHIESERNIVVSMVLCLILLLFLSHKNCNYNYNCLYSQEYAGRIDTGGGGGGHYVLSKSCSSVHDLLFLMSKLHPLFVVPIGP